MMSCDHQGCGSRGRCRTKAGGPGGGGVARGHGALVVRYDAAARRHWVELRGKLLEMLQKANPAGGAGYVGSVGSLELVAGAGFEPAAFRL
ncbi:hypothetical protein Rsph17029_0080 [Rhodobacter sphaeroides ATCC 17029]|nr:hypothetical protein Rsph17029_0080 [Cereibacter sphaeroides ATCC 17029]